MKMALLFLALLLASTVAAGAQELQAGDPLHSCCIPVADRPFGLGSSALPPGMALDSQQRLFPELERRPPLEPHRIAGQVVAGAATGMAVGLATALALSAGEEDSFGAAAVAVLGFLVGYPAGVAAGTYAVGSLGNYTGSPERTFKGALAGGLAGLLLIEQTDGFSLLVLPPVGATVEFSRSRRYRTPPAAQ